MDERNPTVLNLIRSENSLSPLNEMHFTNGVPMECQVTPLVPMDERNPTVLNLIRSENSLSPLNEMYFTNGVPMEYQVTPLVPMDERNPTVLNLIRSENSLSPLNEMYFTNGMPSHSIGTNPSSRSHGKISQVPLMRCISPMVYQWNAKSLYWYQPFIQIPWENIPSPLNEMHFTNGILTDCQANPLDSVCVYWTTLAFPAQS